jgi:rSAM/selenodomain-associated transferase 2
LIAANETGPVHLLSRNRRRSWPPIVCLTCSLLLLSIVFRRIDVSNCLTSLSRARAAWLLLGFAAYAIALAATAVRWHVALRSVQCVVHFLASWRLSLIGHFFATALFGRVGAGTTAKSILHGRWFGFTLADCRRVRSLDYTLTVGAALWLGGMTLLAVCLSQGIQRLSSLRWERADALAVAGCCLLVFLFGALRIRNPHREGLLARIRGVFSSRCADWIACPRNSLFVLEPIAASMAFAFNLAAVSEAPLPWVQLVWTFPVITAMSALPFTLMGTGAREVAALTLLGLYGVPAADAVTASVLTLTVQLIWAGVGATVYRHEARERRLRPTRPMPTTVSVVIPALNETAVLEETIRCVRSNVNVVEIIVVDGGSRDGTGQLAERLGCRVLPSQPGRGQQLHVGATAARGEVVVLLHADTSLPPTAIRAALNCLRDGIVVGGGFWKIYRDAPLLLTGSRIKCALRLLIAKRILGDQAMFVRREVLAKIGGVPQLELMEEFELCRKLRVAGRLALADATVVTSARRFVRAGVIRTAWLTWWLSLRYRLGTPPSELRRIYDRAETL